MIARLLAYFTRNAPDEAWQSTGIRYTTARHHDQALGERSRDAALKREAAARKVAARTVTPKAPKPTPNVVRLERRKKV